MRATCERRYAAITRAGSRGPSRNACATLTDRALFDRIATWAADLPWSPIFGAALGEDMASLRPDLPGIPEDCYAT